MDSIILNSIYFVGIVEKRCVINVLTVSHVEANSATNIEPDMWHLMSDVVDSLGFN